MLTEKQVEAYKQDGYLKVKDLFTQEEVKELNSAMNLIIEDWWGRKAAVVCALFPAAILMGPLSTLLGSIPVRIYPLRSTIRTKSKPCQSLPRQGTSSSSAITRFTGPTSTRQTNGENQGGSVTMRRR